MKNSNRNSDIKLLYQIYTENQKPEDALLFTPLLSQKFSGDVKNDLVEKGCWSETLEKQFENSELYFKIFREDENNIPADAIPLESVRLLPSQGLLNLEKPLKDSITNAINCFSYFIPERAKQTAYHIENAIAQWAEDKLKGFSAYTAVPEVKLMDEKIWQETIRENANFSEEDSGEELPVKSNQVFDTTPASYADFFSSKVWQFASYAYHNPLKAITISLALQTLATRKNLQTTHFSKNIFSQFQKDYFTSSHLSTSLSLTQNLLYGASFMLRERESRKC